MEGNPPRNHSISCALGNRYSSLVEVYLSKLQVLQPACIVVLKSGWLKRQLVIAKREFDSWPAWMRRAMKSEISDRAQEMADEAKQERIEEIVEEAQGTSYGRRGAKQRADRGHEGATVIVQRAYKVELDPSIALAEQFDRASDINRWAYNYALGRKRETVNVNKVLPWLIADIVEDPDVLAALEYLPDIRCKVPTGVDLQKEVVVLKKEQKPWLAEVSKWVPAEAIKDAERAYRNFFEKRAGFPKFHKKGGKASFRLQSDGGIVVDGRRVKLPFYGWVRVKHGHFTKKNVFNFFNERVKKICSATISKVAGRWSISLQVEVELPQPKNGAIKVPLGGVDIGVGKDNWMTISDGKSELQLIPPRPYRKMERRLKHVQRIVSRRKKGSGRRAKAVERLGRLTNRIANVRKDFVNKATTALAKATSAVVVETVSTKAWMGNHRIAKSVADAGLGEAIRQLEYKMAWNGGILLRAPSDFPSSQLCSNCGAKHPEMKMRNGFAETLVCQCGTVLQRDVNAARNLHKWGVVGFTLKTPVESEATLVETLAPLLRESGIGFEVV